MIVLERRLRSMSGQLLNTDRIQVAGLHPRLDLAGQGVQYFGHYLPRFPHSRDFFRGLNDYAHPLSNQAFAGAPCSPLLSASRRSAPATYPAYDSSLSAGLS